MQTFYGDVSSKSQYFSLGNCIIDTNNCNINANNGFTSTSSTMSITFNFSNLYLRHIAFNYKNVTKIQYSYNDGTNIELLSCTSSEDMKSVSLDIKSIDKIGKIKLTITGSNAELQNIEYHVITSGKKQEISTIWFRTDKLVDKDGNYTSPSSEKEISSVKVKVPDGKEPANVWFYVPDNEEDRLNTETYNSTASVDETTLVLESNNPSFGVTDTTVLLTNGFVADDCMTARNMKINSANGN